MHHQQSSDLRGAPCCRGGSMGRNATRTPKPPGSASQTSQTGWTPRRPAGGSGGGPSLRTILWAALLAGALLAPGARGSLEVHEEELIVELHNHYRGQVSPSASAMMPLRWDSTLKVLAESYAAKCIWNHNPELTETGENLYASTSTTVLREGLERWFLEHLDYGFHNNSCPEDQMCGHYTQMVWANTHRVGCAVHKCDSLQGLDFEKVSFLVCNYYPAGNYEDERPYEEGEWCSQCPDNFQKCENHLCGSEMEEDKEEEEEDDDVGGVDWAVTPPPDTAETPLGDTPDPSTAVTPSWTAAPQGTQPPKEPHPVPERPQGGEREGEGESGREREKQSEKKKDGFSAASAAASIYSSVMVVACLTGAQVLMH